MANLSVADGCELLAGVGPKLAERLAALHIHCIGDLLLHRPLRYEDRTQLLPVAQLMPGTTALTLVRIETAEVRYGRRRSLLITASDGQSRLWIRLFHFGLNQQKQLIAGTWLRLFGEVRAGRYGPEMVHPEYRILPDREAGLDFTPELLPVYPSTSGLGQNRLRKIIDQALQLLDQAGFWAELLTQSILPAELEITAAEAVKTLHHPAMETPLQALVEGRHPAVRRLAFEELLGHQLALRGRRRQVKQLNAPTIAVQQIQHGLEPFLQRLGFLPTGAQNRVIAEVLTDMASREPMLRLVQGDVGSGKTVVAAAAAFVAARQDWQTAFMAPTELLAEQHFKNLQQWLQPLDIPVWLVTGKNGLDAGSKRAIEAGEAGILVGTHALFQEKLTIGRLGLCIIDEQHRFGVAQRLALREKSSHVGVVAHQLVMTATPIPRTLAMSAYADLDTSVIDELPPGRTPVTTVAIPNSRRDAVIRRIAEVMAEGRQAYWVCTLVEESEKLEARAAEATAEMLATALPGVRIGLTHGRMKAAEKQKAIAAFKAHRLDILVATTVIEVGVDVPNASLMIIENAERLGLAQLHQLRGRVGRGAQKSYCVLMYQAPLSKTGHARLATLRETNDGFAIAQADLELRGPGEVLGTRQTGMAEFRMADLVRDEDLIAEAQHTADVLLAQAPQQAEALIERWTAASQAYLSV